MKRAARDTNLIAAPFARSVAALLLMMALGLGDTKADEVTFDLRIERGLVPAKSRLVRVRQNDLVRLRWSSDQPIALHLHGYDIEQKVEPSAISEMKFTARATGRFPVQEHKPQAAGGGHTHGAPIVQLEVLPR
jgi:hypothetical protein